VAHAGCADGVGSFDADVVIAPDAVTLAQWPVTVTVFGLPPTVRTHAD